MQQLGKELFKISFRNKKELLIEIGRRFNLTSYSYKAPAQASSAAMLLRKHLSGKRLVSLKQHNFDRVVTLDFDDRRLIAEFFADGNLILADSTGKIIWCFRSEEWKDRKVRRGEIYVYPAGTPDPRELTLDAFKKGFTQKDVVRSLVKLGIPGHYAEEICASTGIDKNKEKPSDSDFKKLYEAMNALFTKEIAPISAAIDERFLKKAEPQKSEKVERLKRRLAEQEAALLRFEKESVEEKQKGDLIYKNWVKLEAEAQKAKKGKLVVEL